MSLTIVTPAAAEPITAADTVLRTHLYLSEQDTAENALLDAFIASARDLVEVYLRRRLITQTVRVTLDRFGCGGSSEVRLPIAPIQSVDQVQYLDDAGDWQTVDPAKYRLIASDEPNVLAPEYGMIWPVTRLDRAVVRIDLVVGYGDAGVKVPPRILQALRLQVAHMFHHRGDTEGTDDLCEMARNMLRPSILWL